MKATRLAPSRTVLIHVAVIVAGIAAAIGSTTSRAQLAPSDTSGAAEMQLRSSVSFRMGMVAERQLAAGSRWRAVGVLPEGTVYRPLAAVVTIDAPAPLEGYPVVAQGRLEGFFLPSDASFVPVSSSRAWDLVGAGS